MSEEEVGVSDEEGDEEGGVSDEEGGVREEEEGVLCRLWYIVLEDAKQVLFFTF